MEVNMKNKYIPMIIALGFPVSFLVGFVFGRFNGGLIGFLLYTLIFSLIMIPKSMEYSKERKAEEQKRLKQMQKNPNEQIACPKCGSTQISANNRGYDVAFGFIGSGEVHITCLRCGHKWRAGTQNKTK